MQEHNYYVYILAKARNSTFYVGVTNDLIRRTYEHKEGLVEGFTRKYGIKILVYYEQHASIHEAISREKLINAGNEALKCRLLSEPIQTGMTYITNLPNSQTPQ